MTGQRKGERLQDALKTDAAEVSKALVSSTKQVAELVDAAPLLKRLGITIEVEKPAESV